MKKTISVLTSLFLLSACNTTKKEINNTKTVTIENKTEKESNTAEESVFQYGMFVASEKVDCQGVAPQKCFMVRASWETTWTVLYGEIEGFDYQPGYEYHLEVKRTTLNNPPADGSAYHYELVRIINKEKKKSDLRPEHEKPTFEGTWRLKKLNGKEVPNNEAYVFFQDQKMSAHSGCNTMSQLQFHQDKNKISFEDTNAPTTMMMCPEDHIEDEYFKTLLSIKKYQATNTVLKFYNKEGKLVLVFER
ncbi:MAG: hypothetical protein CSA38_02875 [Flavobacteriales bacterium]|nr:MAG: hypothetical protein CSA38_02875 [Flavobacteriales bacterium]